MSVWRYDSTPVYLVHDDDLEWWGRWSRAGTTGRSWLGANRPDYLPRFASRWLESERWHSVRPFARVPVTQRRMVARSQRSMDRLLSGRALSGGGADNLQRSADRGLAGGEIYTSRAGDPASTTTQMGSGVYPVDPTSLATTAYVRNVGLSTEPAGALTDINGVLNETAPSCSGSWRVRSMIPALEPRTCSEGRKWRETTPVVHRLLGRAPAGVGYRTASPSRRRGA